MADVRVREHILADVDAAGDALLRRTWVIENHNEKVAADFSRGYFRVEFTNRNVIVVGAEDGRGLGLPWAISEASGGKIAVSCSYNATLPPGRHLVVHLTCRLPQFMPRLHEANGRVGTEYFERLGPFDAGGLVVEEPRLIEYTHYRGRSEATLRVGPPPIPTMAAGVFARRGSHAIILGSVDDDGVSPRTP